MLITLTENDYLAAQKLHARWSQKKLWLVACIAVASIIMAGCLRNTHYAFTAVIFVCGTVGGVLGSCLLHFFYMPLMSRRIFRQHMGSQPAQQCLWDTHGITFEMEGERHAIAWRDIVKWKEGPSLFLLYQADGRFHPVTKASFTDTAACDEFRHQLARI
jgi:YcxB-like protein